MPAVFVTKKGLLAHQVDGSFVGQYSEYLDLPPDCHVDELKLVTISDFLPELWWQLAEC